MSTDNDVVITPTAPESVPSNPLRGALGTVDGPLMKLT